jgi:hypothetical protein
VRLYGARSLMSGEGLDEEIGAAITARDIEKLARVELVPRAVASLALSE